MRAALIPWGRARWPGARVMEELDVGGCRADLAFVQPDHIAVVEIKSSKDSLDRLERQIDHFTWGVPEVWLALAPKWIDPLHYVGDEYKPRISFDIGLVIADGGAVTEQIPWRYGDPHPHKARVDPLMTVPLLHLLHVVELRNVAQSNGLDFRVRWPSRQLMRLLSRKLTGDQIIAGVCRELRARPRGWAGDAPITVAA